MPSTFLWNQLNPPHLSDPLIRLTKWEDSDWQVAEVVGH